MDFLAVNNIEPEDTLGKYILALYPLLPTPSPLPTCWAAFLSDTKHLLIRFRKSTLTQIDNLIFELVIVDNKLMVDFLAVNNIEQEDTVGKYILAL